MVTPVANGCNLPTRPAPAPPNNSERIRRNSTVELESILMKNGTEFATRTPNLSYQFRSQSAVDVSFKKKPPPRPPPPKLPGNSRKQKPAQILTKLFSRKNSTTARPTHTDTTKSLPVSSVPVASLIDLNSPPSSPTFTTRSSSDGVSVDSLSSENGNTSASGNYGTGSQVESGFEDDFYVPPSTNSRESDPFSALKKTNNVAFHNILLSNEDPKQKIKVVDVPTLRSPTIIRTKNYKAPLRPPPPRVSPTSNFSRIPEVDSSAWIPKTDDVFIPNWSSSVSSSDNSSPPMPSMPPPPPPVEVLQVLSSGPPIPPRPAVNTKLAKEPKKERPYCIALYDYVADHESDLSFKEGDVLLLTKRVNEDWLMGCLNGIEGMFPSNYVDIKVPLEDPSEENAHHSKVIAIFDFHPENWDDLSFQEGDEITVLHEINNDWLYGEIDDRKGMFPASFVSQLPES